MTWGAACFLGKFYLILKDNPDLYLIVCAFRLWTAEEVIGFTFVSVVSFLSCYYIRIVGVVRVRTILLFFIWKGNYYTLKLKLHRPLLCPAEVKGKSVTDHQQDT